MSLVDKTEGYNITMTRYFDGLRFGDYDCVVFFAFTDVPKFLEYMPDTAHRLLMLVDDDYYIVRNNITSDHLTEANLTKVVMRAMEKPKKAESTNSLKRYHSGYFEDGLLDTYTIAKEYIERDEEKVIRISWFCKTYEISTKVFNRVIDALDRNGVIENVCRLVYEIEVEESSLEKLRKEFSTVVEVKRKVNILNLSTSAQKTTRSILE